MSRRAAGIPDVNRAFFEIERSPDDYYLSPPHLESHERNLIEEFFPKPPARVLDLGCGAGRTTVPLQKTGYDVVAGDLSARLVREAKRRVVPGNFLQFDASETPFSAASFDAVLFSFNGVDGIYPVERRVACFREVFRVLRPGGLFLFSTHHLLGLAFWGGRWNSAFRTTLALWRGRPARSGWYIRYPEAEGRQFVYSAPPGRTRRQLRSAGFDLVAIRGTRGSRGRARILLTEHHVAFAARRPEPA